MSIGATNRIYNDAKDIRHEIDRQLRRLEEAKDHKRVRKYIGALRHFGTKPAVCSQCKKAMRPDIARIQVENKRENAPICFACCEGHKRK